MTKTTIYLPDALKRQIEEAARQDGRSEADIIREAIAGAMERRRPPQPQVPLSERGLGMNVAGHVDEMLAGFGR